MVNALFLSIAALLLLAALYKARPLLTRPRPQGLGALCGFLTALGLSLVFLTPAVGSVLSAVTPKLGRLLGNCSTLAAATCVSILLLRFNEEPAAADRKARRRVLSLVLAVCALAVLFLSSPVGDSPDAPTFGDLPRTAPLLNVYILVFTGYLGAAVIDLLRQALRYARHAPRAALRHGLRIIALGCGIGLVYATYKIVHTVSLWTDSDWLPPEQLCSSLFTPVTCTFNVGLPALCSVVLLIGILLPAIGPALGKPWRRIQMWRLHRGLHPLWAALYEAVPEIQLTAAEGRDAAPDTEFRLYRRVIEIRDGILLLRPHRSEEVRRAAEKNLRALGRQGRDLAAETEAIVLTAALAARADGLPPAHPISAEDATLTHPELNNLLDEARWLHRVSRAFASSGAAAPHEPASAAGRSEGEA
ncbi:MAB_1171c family putative transporter [Streptomyces sp. NPDC003077]|uniref:MAB_1171c family putative transporter n=1 Tax=Streptomyces sp. NPDC003077 TaxID=3154443 RepID=UPI0033ADB7F0